MSKTRELKFRGQYCRGIENAGCWVHWGINGTDVIDCIDSDTIGQYTGLKDKNDKEIYEGDIIRVFDWGVRSQSNVLGVTSVRWDLDDCGWRYADYGITEDFYDQFRIVEVIGNIHENSELLGRTHEQD